MKDLISRALLRLGFWATKSTAEEDLNRFFSFLRPRAIREPLIRVGSPNDGGYMLPASALLATTLHSAGIADDCNFELQFVNQGEGVAYLMDGSIDQLPKMNERFVFNKSFLGPTVKPGWESLESWQLKHPVGQGGMLALDIEGWEWDLLFASEPSAWAEFDFIVLELHGLERVFNPFFFSTFVSKLLSSLSNFTVVHVHPNNSGFIARSRGMSIPSLLEVTLVNSRLGIHLESYSRLPHPLDADNLPDLPSLMW